MATKQSTNTSSAGAKQEALFEQALEELRMEESDRGYATRFARKYAKQIEEVRSLGWTYDDIVQHFTSKKGAKKDLTGEQLMNALSKARASLARTATVVTPKRKTAKR